MHDDELGTFCKGIYDPLVGTLSLMVSSRTLAEELAQEALARTWMRWTRVRTLEHPEAWTYRVALNLTNSLWRRRAVERRAAERHTAIDVFEDSDVASAIAVRQAVARLPNRQRTALVLRYYADLSVDEAAAVMHCKPGTVKSLSHKAISSLRIALKEPELESL